jgi:hypothetical protein
MSRAFVKEMHRVMSVGYVSEDVAVRIAYNDLCVKNACADVRTRSKKCVQAMDASLEIWRCV